MLQHGKKKKKKKKERRSITEIKRIFKQNHYQDNACRLYPWFSIMNFYKVSPMSLLYIEKA